MNERQQRACGDCSVCCTYCGFDTPEGEKPMHKPCPHLVIEGSGVGYNGHCGIHEKRWDVCRKYLCMWLRGWGLEDDRPDRCGVLIDDSAPIENAIQCRPIAEEAVDSLYTDAAIRRMSRETGRPALITGYPATKIIRVVGRGVE